MSKKRKDPNGYISQSALDFVRSRSSEGTNGTDERPKADWGTVEPNLLLGAIVSATRAGAAILFGMDRSQFLFSVTVYVAGEKVTKYFHPINQFDELQDYLRSIIETIE